MSRRIETKACTEASPFKISTATRGKQGGRPKCTYYQKLGHEKSQCNEFNGYPPNWQGDGAIDSTRPQIKNLTEALEQHQQRIGEKEWLGLDRNLCKAISIEVLLSTLANRGRHRASWNQVSTEAACNSAESSISHRSR